MRFFSVNAFFVVVSIIKNSIYNSTVGFYFSLHQTIIPTDHLKLINTHDCTEEINAVAEELNRVFYRLWAFNKNLTIISQLLTKLKNNKTDA